MVVAVTAGLYGSDTPPRVLVTVTGLTGVERVDVWREPPGEPRSMVRGGIEVTPTGDTLLLVDPEPEVGRPLVYVAQTVDEGVVAQTSAAPITVPDPGRHILSNPLTGASVLVDLVATPDGRTNDVPGSALRPNGSPLAVVIHDVRGADEGEWVVHTRSRAESLDLVDLLADGGPIVSRHPNDGCDVVGREVGWIPRSARNRFNRLGARMWPLPFITVGMPYPTIPSPRPTLADLATYVPDTLADIAEAWDTLLQLSQDDLGTA